MKRRLKLIWVKKSDFCQRNKWVREKCLFGFRFRSKTQVPAIKPDVDKCQFRARNKSSEVSALKDVMAESDNTDIRRLDLFADMEDEHFNALMRGSYVQNFPPQIELITEGEPSDFMHVILTGSVELFSSWNGRETSLATVRPVSTFILAATIRDAPYLMSARTLEKSRIALIPSEDVRAVFAVDTIFARAIVRELAQCYRSVVKGTKDLKLRTSLERLANYLLRLQDRGGRAREFDLNIEKRRLASYLGMTPENLSRAFKNLRAYGVDVNGSRVTINDRDDLERFAKPNPLIDDYST